MKVRYQLPSRYNELLKPQEYVSQYIPLPLDLINQAGAAKQKAQDLGQAERVDLLGKQFNRLDQDAQRSNEAKLQVDSKLEEMSDKDFSDPSVRSEWSKTKREIANRFGPQGDIGSMQANYDAHKAYIKDLDKKLEKGPKEGGIDEITYNKLANISLAKYKGIGDESSTGYNHYQGIAPAGYVDIVDQADKLAKDWKADSIKRGGYYDTEGRFIKKSTHEIETVDPNEVYANILPQLMSDPMNQAYAQQHVMLNTYGKDIPKDQAELMYMDIFDKPAKFAAAKAGYKKQVDTQDWDESNLWLKLRDEEAQAKKEAYETTFSQMGDQGVANLSEVTKAEPTNSILSKIFNFVNIDNQAKGILNLAKVIVPGLSASPEIQKIENELSSKSDLSEDQINDRIEKVSYSIKQSIGNDQKEFRESFGFSNPMYDQAYGIVDMFGKGKDAESNPDYDRAKAVVSSKDPNFKNLNKQQQFDAVKDEMAKFAESSKTNVVLVPMDKKELDFKNAQLSNITGTPTEKTQQLINMGLTANGKFIDFYTGKEVVLSDIAKDGQDIKYMGELENDNQFGPGMNYFQSSDGKFYVSPGSLNSQKENYINWNLQQLDNKFSKQHEFPLQFDDRRRINTDGTIPAGVPKGSISQDLKTGKYHTEFDLGNNDKVSYVAENLDDAKIQIAEALHKRGYTIEQLKQLGL